ncbi:MAG: hypothetical protein KGI27_02695 [Thaumarchaeota archaeon]|nr:hypothetical protein [Nitrososphaerota archaeon]
MSDLKVEILLPLYYNKDKNGRRKKIGGEHYLKTYEEIVEKFGGCTQDNIPLLGGWKDPITKERIEDENITWWVVCKNDSSNIKFLRQFKTRLKRRFQQKDIMIYYIVINRL